LDLEKIFFEMARAVASLTVLLTVAAILHAQPFDAGPIVSNFIPE
jgi:hypothetical protein